MAFPRPIRSWLVVAVLLAACGGGGGGDGLAAPANLAATPASDEYVDQLELTWTPVSGADHYELQARIGTGNWATVDVSPSGTGAADTYRVGFQAAAPEATGFGFRLRAINGSGSSPWSSEVTIYRGIRPASGLQALDPGGGQWPIDLLWTRGSTQATGILLQRAVTPHGSPAGAWSALPGVGLADVSCSDQDVASWQDGATMTYSLTYQLNGHSSLPAVATSSAARPATPTGLAATPAGPTTIQLTWTPHSAYADRQVVVRTSRTLGQAVELPAIPASDSSLVDTVPASGVYTYSVRAQVGAVGNIVNLVAVSDPVTSSTELPAGAPFTVAFPTLPAGDQAARDSTGAFGLVQQQYPAGPAVALASVPSGSGWAQHLAAADRGLITPAILFDPQDRPHLFTSVLTPALTDQPHHEWLATGAWQAESLPSYRVNDVAVDATGAFHAVSCDSSFAYLTNASGAWTAEPLTGSVIGSTCHIAVGPDGDPRIAYFSYLVGPGGETYQVSWLRRVSGSWVDEPVPGTDLPVAPGWSTFLRALAPTAGRTVIVYVELATGADPAIRAVVRDGTTWGSVESVGTRPFNGQDASYAAAADPAGRLLVAWNGWLNGSSGAPGVAALRGAAGGWSPYTLFDAPAGVAAGFTPDGKGWVLEGLGVGSYLLYEER